MSETEAWIARQLALMNQRPAEPLPSKSREESRKRRKEAIARGESTYLGNPCYRKHSGMRLVKNGECVDCRNLGEKKRQHQRAQQRTDVRQTKSTESSLRDLK